MQAFIAAFILVVAIGAVAGVIMSEAQEPAYEAFSTSGARVSDPGDNLVGPDWSGLYKT